MICITVAPTSRTLAKADLLNAARQGDIVELCLDHFVKEPDVKELLAGIGRPVIVSCRRPQDGGAWRHDEEERLMLLRQAIVAGPAYIELDLDIAPRIPRFGSVQRVISFTRMDEPETDIDAIFYQASNAQADVVKFTWPTPTIDAAWPLLAAVSQKRILPVVGMGLGRPELTFSLLGRKYGSPWIYAALEKGMEAHPGQATVFELDEVYRWREVNPRTAFIAVAGFGDAQTTITRTLNDAFHRLEMNVRCLPIQLGEIGKLKKMLNVLKIRAVVVSPDANQNLLALAEHVDESDRASGHVDLLLKRDDGWHGYNSLWRAGLRALEEALGRPENGKGSLEGRQVLVIGNGGLAASMVHAAGLRQGLVSVCGPGDKQAKQLAQEKSCRLIPFQNLYDTYADVVVIADPKLEAGMRAGQVNPSLLRPPMTVLDVSHLPRSTEFLQEAQERGCRVIDPREVFAQQIRSQFKAITGKEFPM